MECPICSYEFLGPVLRCPDCSSQFTTDELEELRCLRYMEGRLQSWNEAGANTPSSFCRVCGTRQMSANARYCSRCGASLAAFSRILAAVRQDADQLEEHLGIRVPPQAEAALPAVEQATASVPAVPAVQPAQHPAAIPATPRREAPPAPPVEPFSWARVGEALLSRRTLQTLLYLGATLLVLSAIILVVRLWGDLHWIARQAILLAGMSALLWCGYQVREKMGLRLSGGALMDIGALWVPLNVGALLFEFMDVQGEATIPGVGVPLGLPMVGWMAIAAVSTPVYAWLAYRFRLVLMVYGAAIGAGATLLTGLAALGVPLEWQLAAVMFVGPLYVWIASAQSRNGVNPPNPVLVEGKSPLAPLFQRGVGGISLKGGEEGTFHLFWLTQSAVPALLATVVGLVVSDPEGQRSAVTAAAWAAVLFYGVSYLLYRGLAFEYLATLGLPVALLVTLALHVPAMPLAWHNLILAGMAAAYLVLGRYVRKSPLWSRGEAPTLSTPGVRVDPTYAAAMALSVAAAVWPAATVPSAMAALYGLVVVYGAAAWMFQQRALSYVAVFLLFAPFALTIHWLDIGPHWRALLFVPLAVAYLAAAELDAARHGEGKLPARRLLDTAAPPLKALYARPLFLVGYAATLVAAGFAAADLIGIAEQRGELVYSFTGGDPAPWTYLLAAGVFAASTYLRRTSVFAHLAAWLFLPFALLLAERGFYAGVSFEAADYALLLGLLSPVYLGLGLALDRAPGHYSRALYLAGYILTGAAMAGTAGAKAANLAMVSMSVAIYAASAWWVHRGGHPAFRWLIESLPFEGEGLAGRMARGAFLYLATGLFPVAVLLAISFAGPGIGWYGVALVSMAAFYLAVPETFRRGDPAYRYHWYAFGLALSAIGVVITLADPTLRVVAIAIVTARYAASAAIVRQPLWAYPVAALLPALLVLSLERAGVSASYYGVALLGLAVAYAASGLAWRPDELRRLGWPQGSEAGAYTLPFLALGFLVSAAGVVLACLESREIIVAALALAALFYLLAALALRQSVLLYPVSLLLASSYGVGLTLTGIAPGYYGLAALPGAVAALAVGLALGGYAGRYHPWRWLLREDSGLSRRRLTFVSPALPFYLVAYAGTVAALALSLAMGDGWPLFWSLTSVSAIYAYSAWRFSAPTWTYPALLAAHIGLIRLLFLLSPGLAWNQAGAYLIPAVFLMAGLAWWAARSPGRAGVVSFGTLRADFKGLLARDWSLPFLAFAALGAAVSTALASIEGGTGLLVGLVYATPLAVGASWARKEALAWGSLLFLALSLGQGLRLAGTLLLDSPIYIALAGVGLVAASFAIRWRESEADTPRRNPPNPPLQRGAREDLPLQRGVRGDFFAHPERGRTPWEVWESPVRAFSLLATGLAPVLGLGFWLAGGGVSDDLQPLVFTLAITGLALVGIAYLEQRRWLAYLSMALLEAAYMTQLVVFDSGQPQLFVAPAALYLLALSFLECKRRAAMGDSQGQRLFAAPSTSLRAGLELAGLGLLLGVTLLQSMGLFTNGVNHQAYSLVLFFESLAVILWGLSARWKRSFFGGIGAFIANLVVLLFDPLGEGPVSATILWSVFGAVGAALVLGAVYLERNREKSAAAFRGLLDRLETWD